MVRDEEAVVEATRKEILMIIACSDAYYAAISVLTLSSRVIFL